MKNELKMPIYWGLIEYLASLVPPEQVLAFHISHDMSERLEILTEKNKDGDISSEERRELDTFIEFDQCVMILKARATAHLKIVNKP